MLIQAAANDWKVQASDCTVDKGVISHAASGRTTTYGKVAQAAAQLEPPAEVQLKDPKDWKIAGKPVKRLDTAASSTIGAQRATNYALQPMSVDAFVAAQAANPQGKNIQDGVYTLQKEMSAASAVDLMLSPKSRNNLIIAEGKRNADIYRLIDDRLGVLRQSERVRIDQDDRPAPAPAQGRVDVVGDQQPHLFGVGGDPAHPVERVQPFRARHFARGAGPAGEGEQAREQPRADHREAAQISEDHERGGIVPDGRLGHRGRRGGEDGALDFGGQGREGRRRLGRGARERRRRSHQDSQDLSHFILPLRSAFRRLFNSATFRAC